MDVDHRMGKLAIEEQKNKQRYKDFLIDLVEQKIMIRKSDQRIKKVELLQNDDKSVHFEIKK